jgi:hypothetical protein
MSYIAIGAVTKSIAELLGKKLNKPQLMGSGTHKVTTLPPDDDRVDDNDGVNLFLYRVSEDPYNKNMNWRGDRSNPGTRRPALSLNLYYLLTGYAKKSNGTAQDDITAHQILGNAMSILHEHPVLNEIHDADFDADLDTQFPQELCDSFEKIKITLLPNSVEEYSKIWTGLNKAYRLSVTYEVSLVQIAPIVPVGGAAPAVQQIGLDVGSFGSPVIELLEPSNGAAGSEVTIKGKGFRARGASTSVMIDDLTLSEPDLLKVSDDEIILIIPEAPQRGPRLHVAVMVGGIQSNSLPYDVSPWILSPQPLRGFTGVPLTIPFEAPTGTTISVEIDGQPASFTIDATEKLVRATVPASITANGPKAVVVIVNGVTPVRSNARFFEVLPMIEDLTVVTSTTPDKTTITVTGQRLKGADVNIKYGKLRIPKGENTSPTTVIVEVPRILPSGLPVSVTVDGRESNVLPPRLNTIDPSQAFAGDEITLTGSGLSGQSLSVNIGGIIVPLQPQAAPSFLKVKVPPALPAGPVTVKATVNNKDTNALSLLILG